MCCLWRRAEQQLAEAPPAKARDPREGSDEALRRGLAASESSLALGAPPKANIPSVPWQLYVRLPLWQK